MKKSGSLALRNTLCQFLSEGGEISTSYLRNTIQGTRSTRGSIAGTRFHTLKDLVRPRLLHRPSAREVFIRVVHGLGGVPLAGWVPGYNGICLWLSGPGTWEVLVSIVDALSTLAGWIPGHDGVRFWFSRPGTGKILICIVHRLASAASASWVPGDNSIRFWLSGPGTREVLVGVIHSLAGVALAGWCPLHDLLAGLQCLGEAADITSRDHGGGRLGIGIGGGSSVDAGGKGSNADG
jgi:hypothetical protein